ncbi:TlpA family protein disulfide reductase [Mucilaginibacter rubeus]|uniref:TlpA family protein disulfide reductase n=1 Tax=Mucilaginibacter rubeus TaxID=2027860 RepID=A0AAE6JDP8_9SPHI|nr:MULTISPECIES: TlpA disulfide reductase family protein [Mucilaginibacter]QEM03718.1 TlpA family protein disulfide reductase [Mucilaginibacter rubeus]QEM16329.1 TlpA family protein disulfide reductase [Mucilaginibacter gossypii]QTE40906.1 TlpA family protein disulfide reductase [Mucilaginibacter rubeus]QTE47509.1 TlpA family protein disulfide reductase [Mucilaginibacter rubeus]QTE58901.1 TlpA family protein disulfide reductase [Mucilaginibacter rubeus]
MKNLTIAFIATLFIFIYSSRITFAQSSVRTGSIDSAKITVLIPEIDLSEKLELTFSDQVVKADRAFDNGETSLVSKADKHGLYVFHLKVPPTRRKLGFYIRLSKIGSSLDTLGRNDREVGVPIGYGILENYFVQGGDDIKIVARKKSTFRPLSNYVRGFSFNFSGKGAQKYSLRYLVDSIEYWREFAKDYIKADSTFNVDNLDMRIARKAIDTIKHYRAGLDLQAYNELCIHAYFSAAGLQYDILLSNLHGILKNSSVPFKKQLFKSLSYADSVSRKRLDRTTMISSNDFWSAELRKYRTITDCKNWKPDTLAQSLAPIGDAFIKENLYILVTKMYLNRFRNLINFFKIASLSIKTDVGKSQLAEMMKTTKGMPAYNFDLTDAKGHKVKLSEFAGKVVFIDFWYTGCGNCINYYRDVLSKVEEKFANDPNVVFISISIDKNKEGWLKSIQSGTYTSDNIVNLYTNGDGMSDPVIKFYQVLGYPRPLVIDKLQRLYKVDNTLRNMDILLSTISAAKAN